jgi:hypothetical protein
LPRPKNAGVTAERIINLEERVMRYDVISILIVFLALAFLCFPWVVKAQEVVSQVIEIHRNVRLIETPVLADLPEELKQDYEHFLPMLEESLRAMTSDESEECALTIQVGAGFKEYGAAKVKKVFARLTAYRRNSNLQFVARIYMHNFATDAFVSMEEISDFLQQQVLGPAQCKPKTTRSTVPLSSSNLRTS